MLLKLVEVKDQLTSSMAKTGIHRKKTLMIWIPLGNTKTVTRRDCLAGDYNHNHNYII